MVKHVTIHLTNRCNLNCGFCHIDAKKRVDEIVDKDFWKNIFVDSLSSISIAGGEPFAEKERLYFFLNNIPKQITDIAITSNGIAITNEDINILAKRGIRLQVSLDGVAVEHDKNRGSGSYQKTKSNLIKAINSGVRVDVLTTVTKSNAYCMEEHIMDMDDVGVTNLTLLHFTPKGRGKMVPLEEIHRQEWIEYIYMIKNNISTKRMRVWIQPRYLSEKQLYNIERTRNINVCNYYFMEYAYVDMVTGDVYPCGLAYNTPLIMGNIMKNNLDDISKMAKMNRKFPTECLSCKNVELCRGGAKCYAWMEHRDIKRKDPSCVNDSIIPSCPFPAIMISGPMMKTIRPTIV